MFSDGGIYSYIGSIKAPAFIFSELTFATLVGKKQEQDNSHTAVLSVGLNVHCGIYWEAPCYCLCAPDRWVRALGKRS